MCGKKYFTGNKALFPRKSTPLNGTAHAWKMKPFRISPRKITNQISVIFSVWKNKFLEKNIQNFYIFPKENELQSCFPVELTIEEVF